MTKQRAAILEVIRRDRSRHYTAEQIYEMAREILPGISRATVYNNLKALTEEMAIRKISGESGSDRYDSSFTPHAHLYCDKCGEISDFSVEGFESILSDVIGSEINSYELKVRGICSSCRHRGVS